MHTIDDYKSFECGDFITDEWFQDWLISPDAEKDKFWNDFLNKYPERKYVLEDAVTIIREVRSRNPEWPDEKVIRTSFQRAMTVIEQEENEKVIPMSTHRSRRWWVAASVVVLLGLSAYFLISKFSSDDKLIADSKTKEKVQTDIAPGGNKAILTLADGTKIILDSANNGAITRQGNITVIKLNDGQIAYNSETGNLKPETHTPQSTTYNTISTPRGGQYQLVLADGSKVWLNAASSLTYPTAFMGNERKVTLTGEGYFEVAHDASKPFFVSTGKMDIRVLGTHFNVNAYGDDGTFKTTLLEGKVNVSAGSQSAVLQPGEQARISGNSMEIRKDVNTEEVISWKNGLFYFDNADIEVVMGQLARWYDVDVEYEGSIPKRRFAGEIQKSLTLSQVMKLLSQNKINFEIQGKKLIVKP